MRQEGEEKRGQVHPQAAEWWQQQRRKGAVLELMRKGSGRRWHYWCHYCPHYPHQQEKQQQQQGK